jgi:hypothetical protein
MSDPDLPEGVINADPPGAWESGDAADTETDEQSAMAVESPDLVTSDQPSKDVDPDVSAD